MKGIVVYTLAKIGERTNYDQFILVGEGIDGDTKPTKARPPILLVRGDLLGRTFLKAVMPDDARGESPMFGGRYVTSSEARFPSEYPIPLYDRFE